MMIHFYCSPILLVRLKVVGKGATVLLHTGERRTIITKYCLNYRCTSFNRNTCSCEGYAVLRDKVNCNVLGDQMFRIDAKTHNKVQFVSVKP
jgi:hypothetical protein